MLAMTKKSGYGLIALVHLAKLKKGDVISARELADVYGMSSSLLMNVLKSLAGKGFVISSRGAKGGYQLAKPPEEIDAAEAMEAADGPIQLAECIMDDEQRAACELEKKCPIAVTVHNVHKTIVEVLKKLSIADIAAEGAEGCLPVDRK